MSYLVLSLGEFGAARTEDVIRMMGPIHCAGCMRVFIGFLWS